MWIGIFRIALLVLDIFVTLTAIGGGIALATGLEGNRIPTEWLEGTPFKSYVVPGLVLAVVVGGSAAVATIATFDSRDAGGVVSIFAGAILSGFIVAEVFILNQPSPWNWTEVFYFATGLLMITLGLIVWRF